MATNPEPRIVLPKSTPAVESLPVLAVKGTVLFPNLILPLAVGRPASLKAVEAAAAGEPKQILVVAQRDSAVETPGPNDLFAVGTRAVIKKLAPGENATELLVQGLARVRIDDFPQTEPFLRAIVRPIPDPRDEGPQVEALQRTVMEQAQAMVSYSQPQVKINLTQMLSQASDPLELVFMLGSMLSLDVSKEQALLETESRLSGLQKIYEYLKHELRILEVRQQIAQKAASEVSEEQRKFMLRKQLSAIKEELGEAVSEEEELGLLKKRVEDADLPAEVRKEVERELKKLAQIRPISPDYQVGRSYLDLVLELPWNRTTRDTIHIRKAKTVLNQDHYDLKEVKERILDQLSVMKLNPEAHAPILCLVGPPGVGKTSLGQSIARAIGRKFERMSLGGLHDEAELRGHRRTYIGAMPGRIIQAVRRAGTRNPVLMLDEVDKLGRDFRGDPTSALMEILDPAQNALFRDNYLDLPFDLSKVFFITTANGLESIPRPLLDRMEVLRIPGYSSAEKVAIAKRYLVPRAIKEAGLKPAWIRIPDAVLQRMISHYTREAGVRELNRMIGRLCQKVARRIAEGRKDAIRVTVAGLPRLLGKERYAGNRARRHLPPGVAAGLAWTDSGGEVLYVEAIVLPDGKDLRLTGSLGEVMQESAKAAQSWVWAHATALGIDHALFKDAGVHIHLPAGAIPKDGPSAGIALVMALVSAYTNKPTLSDTAMTGEITLAGLVEPVGGVKEKVLAAHRTGMRRVILPAENRKDLDELPRQVRKELAFVFVHKIEEALAVAWSGACK